MFIFNFIDFAIDCLAVREAAAAADDEECVNNIFVCTRETPSQSSRQRSRCGRCTLLRLPAISFGLHCIAAVLSGEKKTKEEDGQSK